MTVGGSAQIVPRALISGISSGVGKSLIMTGLIAHMRKQGISASCCVVGSALHQGLVYNRLCRRYSHTIDREVLDADAIFRTLAHAQIGADVLLIDGRGGLYDGITPGDLFASDADLAALTKTPLIVVADVKGFSSSLAALIKGYVEFDSRNEIRALIANRVHVPDADALGIKNPEVIAFNENMKLYGLPGFIGGLPIADFEAPIPPSICSQRENVTSIARDFFLDIASLVAQHIDIDAIMAIASTAEPIEVPSRDEVTSLRNCRIAISDDTCFSTGYQDNLAWLSYLGAELVPFSPLADVDIPKKVGGIYLTGAFLQTYGEELAQNESIRAAIRSFAERGGVVFSEGAGTAFLCRAYRRESGGSPLPGVGIIPAEAVPLPLQQTPITASGVEDTVLGGPGTVVKGISTGEWGIPGLMQGGEGALLRAMRVVTPEGKQLSEIYSPTAQSVSTFHFLHFGSNPEVAKALVRAATVLPPKLSESGE
jgi:cobyrinic acid a,c-diamide synthase